jgi:diguanylate cyclase (GGDEF)-like protein
MTNETAVAERNGGAFSLVVDKLRRAYTNLWSATTFATATLVLYAEDIMQHETRRGIRIMALLSLLIQLVTVLFQLSVGHEVYFVYTCTMLALLSLFVYASAGLVKGIRLLYLLGILLLIISAGAVMFLARTSGSLSPTLMASLVLLFMAMPLVPWGLREAISVVVLTYVLLILSMLSVPGRFDQQTLSILQLLTFAAALVAGILIARNVYVRKGDIRTRFGLEKAREKMRLISLQDPLTGAWNRRFLEDNFAEISARAHHENLVVNLAVLDVDSFKLINDAYGHDFGDTVLRRLAAIFMETLPDNAYLVRLGGDEFAMLYIGEGCTQLMQRCLRRLETELEMPKIHGDEPIGVSVGFAEAGPGDPIDLSALYRAADRELYEAKRRVYSVASRDRRGRLRASA